LSTASVRVMENDPAKSRRVEMILRQIDSLPTLPAVAVRLLALTARDDTDARQVIEVVASDQALTAKVLSLCRRADLGLRDGSITIEKAVVLLGFTAVRNAALSLKVFEVLDDPASVNRALGSSVDTPSSSHSSGVSVTAPAPVRFDRQGFWRHSLAVALCAEFLAYAHRDQPDLSPGDAFVCGLLHDIGKVALDYVLPKSMSRVIELVELNQSDIAEFERRIIGLDHHTAGKRMAEQWQLPQRLQDCIWLHGSAYETLPKLEHRRLIGLVGLADLIVRRQHIGFSGNFVMHTEPAALARAIGLDPSSIDDAIKRLPDELQRRASILGLEEKPSRELLLQSIQNANSALGRLNAQLDRKTHAATRQVQILDAITAFHSAVTPGRSVLDTLNSVVSSATQVLGSGFYAMLCQNGPGQPWLIAQFDDQGQERHHQVVEPPPHAPSLASFNPAEPVAVGLAAILPWIEDYLIDAQDLRQVKILPLSCGWGTVALLLHDRPSVPALRQITSLTSTWAAAIASAGQHEGARRIGEELVEANRTLAATQERLLRTESLARLGEMAAGAAHEMNNPLAVIVGRSQLLAMKLPAGSNESKAAHVIAEQANRLSDLITAMRLFADPPRATLKPSDVSVLLSNAIQQANASASSDSGRGNPVTINLQVRQPMPPVPLDGEQFASAVKELLLNAIQSAPKSAIHVSAQLEPVQRRLMIQVTDDGCGMDAHTLAHATDPFFSNKPAGRRVGMGLTRAQQLAVAHNGQVELRSTVGSGTVATLWVPLDSLG
jgi:signal transduction histidine kinase/HD-like signal output (HDOD) protein